MKSLTARLRHRVATKTLRPEDRESGSLILDILIGMAIFALIAIIAVSAIGQYRGRAYVQAAVSDATAAANAVNGLITDRAADGGEFPIGLLDEDALAALEVTPTGTGANASNIVVAEGSVTADDFMVCVDYRSAFAVYATDEGGIVYSGNMDDEGFPGCEEAFGEGPTGPDPASLHTEDECVSYGFFWYEAAADETQTQDAMLSLDPYMVDRSTRTYVLPWDIGHSRDDYIQVEGEAHNDVILDWWPTTPAEQAQFEIEIVDEEGFMVAYIARRGGDRMTYDIVLPGHDAYCGHPY